MSPSAGIDVAILKLIKPLFASCGLGSIKIGRTSATFYRGPARVSALGGADLSPPLALRAVGQPGAGVGAVAGVVGGGVAEGDVRA